MSGYQAAIIFFVLIFVVGFIIPFCISPFVNTDIPNYDSSVSPLVTLITAGIPINILIIHFKLDLLGLFPDTIQNYMTKQLNAFTYLPDYVSIPLLIIIIVSLIYAVLSFIPTIPAG